MRKNKTTNNAAVKKEFDLKECFALWRQTSKTGTQYFTGKTSEEDEAERSPIIGFFTVDKQNPTDPDVRIYIKEKDAEGKPVLGECIANLWGQISQNFNEYLTGETNEKEDLVGFFTKKDDKGKVPDIRVYYKK